MPGDEGAVYKCRAQLNPAVSNLVGEAEEEGEGKESMGSKHI